MDFPLPLTEWQWIAFAVFLGLIVFLIWKFRLEQVVQYPLPNEEDLGIGMIALPGKLNVGRMTTARRYWQEQFAKKIASADQADQKDLIIERDEVLGSCLIAQRVGRDRKFYAFDGDILDPKFHVRMDKGSKTPVRWIGPVQDCLNVMGTDGEYIFAKLSTESHPFTDEEREHDSVLIRTMSYTALAAESRGKIKFLEDRNKTVEDQLSLERQKNAQLSSKSDMALSALDQHSLARPESNKMPGTFMPKVKEWFGTPWQLVTMVIAYFISPLIMTLFSNNIAPTSTAYVTLAITVLGFFIIPFVKKVFGRWL
jgi:hypothetical protein